MFSHGETLFIVLEVLVSNHLGKLFEKVIVTRAGHLKEYALEVTNH